MPIIEPKYIPVKEFKGVHLYHAAISNCSMRVRIVLEEKNLEWVSHHLDIAKREHITEEYFGINPNGVVPTLVHDGVVIIESDDIIEYLDERFSEIPLRPTDQMSLKEMKWWLDAAIDIHVKAVKTYIYYNKMRGKMRMSVDQEQKYRQLQKNPELLKFHNVSSSDAGFSEQEVIEAENILTDIFTLADQKLANQFWLAGDNYSLADIAWIPLFFTLKGAGYQFEQFKYLSAWAGRVTKRNSFKKGVLDWCPKF